MSKEGGTETAMTARISPGWRKFRELSSSPVVYCNTNPEARTIYNRVHQPSEESFTSVEKNGHFDVKYNVVMRHKCRMNGQQLLLSEVASLYQFVGEEESKKLFPVYSNNLDQIPVSDILVGDICQIKYGQWKLCCNVGHFIS